MMLSGRPLLPSADRQYLVHRPEADALAQAVKHRLNTLLLAERGMGKTTLLRDVEARVTSELRLTTVYVDGRRLDDAATILLAVRDALDGPSTPMSDSLRAAAMPFVRVPTEVRNEQALRVVRELAEAPRAACILLDDPDAEVVHRLFGRLRDELWKTGLVWIVAGDAAQAHRYLTPPSDAFFERIVKLAPLTEEQQDQLIRKRLDGEPHPELAAIRVKNGNPRTLLATLREVATGGDAQTLLAARAQRQQRVDATLGALAGMMLAEIEDGAVASAADPEWLERFGISRQRAQQVLSALERTGNVQAERVPGPNGRPRKVYRRIGPAA
jgi:type II secretory pathway predicted ATPase ExeA